MDPISALGLAANVAGLVSLTIEVSQLLADYLVSVKNASVNVKALNEEYVTLQHVLMQLSAFLRSDNAKSNLFQGTSVLRLTIESCQGNVQGIATKLKTSKHKMTRALEKLRWPFEEKEISKHIDRIRKHVAIFQFSLTVENWYLSP
jgi:Fungal N-terminal domain of STAND proteins